MGGEGEEEGGKGLGEVGLGERVGRVEHACDFFFFLLIKILLVGG